MKKITLLCAALVFSAFANEPEEFEGLLTTPGCAAQGAFADCYLENYVCGSDGCFRKTEVGVTTKEAKYALYQHNTGKVYTIDTTKLKLSEMREGINKNGVIVVGTLDEATNTIKATEFKSPPPPKKSFFKGCL
ncbi:MAG: hypothetical protein Q8M43_10745 [Sulfuricurvum sp.]|uniref:hypothetical protein n=1 Tax=Sulfuricurvum sp. TaxID=2025608 RepID=UPI00271CA845|nr:hypothetical protein [Sulfuricurvum sp.]MDO9055279.1 hypothetical protein [Sulfuricurvum sp.]MDP3292496.1 hypothetical protein [Sulfuricurvum sp.]